MSKTNKKTVLVGGCFDVLHPGHIIFLKKAKQQGDKLVVLLESDKKIKILKGVNRPVHNQEQRAFVLSALKFVDEVVLLPFLEDFKDYDEIVAKIKPDIIAVTEGDLQVNYKKRSAQLSGAKLKIVTKRIGKFSTSNLLKDRV
jgi:FAD synthetase